MGKITGFLEFERQDRGYDKPEERLRHYKEFVHPLGGDAITQLAEAHCRQLNKELCAIGQP